MEKIVSCVETDGKINGELSCFCSEDAVIEN